MNEAGGILPEPDDSLNCHERGEMTSRPDQRTEHTELGAIVTIVGIEGVADEAAVAGAVAFPAAPQTDEMTYSKP